MSDARHATTTGRRSGKPGVAPRIAAAENLRRILDGGAHSNVLLDQPGTKHAAERASVQRLTLDTLRWLPLVDWYIAAMAGRPVSELDPPVLHSLRIALTELHLGGDAHGVVDSAVEAVRISGAGRASGFVNALSRRFAAGRDVPQPATEDGDALLRGFEPWMWRRLVADHGRDEADALARGLMAPAPIGIRLRRPVAHPPGRSVDGIRDARLVDRRDDVAALGDAAVVMDPASTAVVHALGVEPGDHVLDVAAAPGNKTAGLWDTMGGAGMLVAADAHPRRSKRLDKRLRRLSVPAQVVVADGGAPPFPSQSFDKILLDAPCTGLGTLRRRPEIKLRLQPSSPETMGRLQRTLLERSLDLLRPDGMLVYSVCTVFAAETNEVVDGLGGMAPDDVPGRPYGDGVLLAPHLTDTDGMFIAVFRR